MVGTRPRAHHLVFVVRIEEGLAGSAKLLTMTTADAEGIFI